MRWRRLWAGFWAKEHRGFHLAMTALFALFVGVGTLYQATRDAPVVWGTFTEVSTTCGPRTPFTGTSARCAPLGTFVSDDQSVSIDRVQLHGSDGRWGSARTVRAAWVPTGNPPVGPQDPEYETADYPRDVVFSEFSLRIDPWWPWPAAAIVLAIVWFVHRPVRGRTSGGKDGYVSRHGASSDQPPQA